jgi:hypothetical protein
MTSHKKTYITDITGIIFENFMPSKIFEQTLYVDIVEFLLIIKKTVKL